MSVEVTLFKENLDLSDCGKVFLFDNKCYRFLLEYWRNYSRLRELTSRKLNKVLYGIGYDPSRFNRYIFKKYVPQYYCRYTPSCTEFSIKSSKGRLEIFDGENPLLFLIYLFYSWETREELSRFRVNIVKHGSFTVRCPNLLETIKRLQSIERDDDSIYVALLQVLTQEE